MNMVTSFSNAGAVIGAVDVTGHALDANMAGLGQKAELKRLRKLFLRC